jgi:hypothetical protein
MAAIKRNTKHGLTTPTIPPHPSEIPSPIESPPSTFLSKPFVQVFPTLVNLNFSPASAKTGGNLSLSMRWPAPQTVRCSSLSLPTTYAGAATNTQSSVHLPCLHVSLIRRVYKQIAARNTDYIRLVTQLHFHRIRQYFDYLGYFPDWKILSRRYSTVCQMAR